MTPRSLLLGALLLAGPPQTPPKPPPAAWQGLIGEYGADSATTVMVLERNGTLVLRRNTAEHGLRQVGAGWFRLGDTVVQFRRGDLGRAVEIRVGNTVLKKMALGPEEGSVFRIVPVRPVEQLRTEALAAAPPPESGSFRDADLTELIRLDPSIRLDIRYAGSDNFLGTPLYSSPRAFLQRPAAEALVRAHRRLRARGYGLLVHDGYRPWYVTRMFWDATPPAQHEFVADPATGSRHNRGCAVDLTLYDLNTGKPVQMPGTYDEFSHRSYPGYPGGTSRQRWFRALLQETMETEGFTVYTSEWWHFDFRDWKQYRIGNASFEQLTR
jgi:D-alanyl-D-alanine dipeptidase